MMVLVVLVLFLIREKDCYAGLFFMVKKPGISYSIVLICWIGLTPWSHADSWWASKSVEEEKTVSPEIRYQRILYKTIMSEPVRAHILDVTGIGSKYLFGVLGSYGALIPPTVFAKQSGAVAVVNGGYFSTHPNRAMGLVAAHGRVLYPPHAGNHIRGAVGFHPNGIVVDWIGPEDIRENRIVSTKESWNSCYAALGAGPLLVKRGQSRVQTDEEGFNFIQRAPRTAIGKTDDERIVLIVIDGRQPDWSAGVTLGELADLFLSLRTSEALNLDGGGSSVMVIQNQIVNRPSDNTLLGAPGQERAVANVVALLDK